MSRQHKQPGAPVAEYRPLTEEDWQAIYKHVALNGTLSGAIRAVLGPDRNPSAVYKALQFDPVGRGRQLEQARQAFRDKLVSLLLARAQDMPKAARWKGEVIGYDLERGDTAAIVALARHYLPGWRDKVSESDLQVRVSGNAGDDDDVLVPAITYSMCERMPLAMRRQLADVLKWIDKDNAEHATRREIALGGDLIEGEALQIEHVESGPFDMLAPDEAELARSVLA